MPDSEDEIRIAAYMLWIERGCPEGQALQDWIEAEDEFRKQRKIKGATSSEGAGFKVSPHVRQGAQASGESRAVARSEQNLPREHHMSNELDNVDLLIATRIAIAMPQDALMESVEDELLKLGFDAWATFLTEQLELRLKGEDYARYVQETIPILRRQAYSLWPIGAPGLSMEGLIESAAEARGVCKIGTQILDADGSPSATTWATVAVAYQRHLSNLALQDSTYSAFISYKHATSNTFARSLELALKRYARPLFRPPLRIFRDEKLLRAGDNLAAEIARGLEESEFLILLASKEAAESRWVKDELWRWCGKFGRQDRLIIVLTQGNIELTAGNEIDWEQTDALPRELAEFLRVLPLFVDVRETPTTEWDLRHVIFRNVVNQIVAKLRDCTPEEMNDQEVLQYRRNVRLKNVGLMTLTLLAIIATAFGWIAYRRGNTIIEKNEVLSVRNEKINTQNKTLANNNATITKQNLQLRTRLSDAFVLQSNVSAEQKQLDKAALYLNAARDLADTERVHAAALTLENSPTQYRGRIKAKSGWFQYAKGGSILFTLDDKNHLHEWDLSQPSISRRDRGRFTKPVINPDGAVVAQVDGRTVHLVELSNGRELVSFGHKEGPNIAITALAFGPLGNRIAAGPCFDAHLRIWRKDGIELTKLFVGSAQVLHSLAFSPDGLKLACTKNGDSIVRLWNLPEDGEPTVRELSAHKPAATAVAFAPDSQTLATCGLDRQVVLWDVKTGTSRLRVGGHTAVPNAVSFSPDTSYCVSGDDDGNIWVWSTRTGELVVSLDVHSVAIERVAFSPDGRQLVAGTRDGWLYFWDFVDRATPHLGLNSRACYGATFGKNRLALPAGRRPPWAENVLDPVLKARHLLTFSNPHPPQLTIWDRAQLIDLQTGQRIRLLDEAENPVVAVEFHPKDDMLAKGKKNGSVELWSNDASRHVSTVRSHDLPIACILFSDDGKFMAACDDKEFRVCIWNVEGRPTCLSAYQNLLFDETPVIGCPVQFDHDSRYLLTNVPRGLGNNQKHMWDVELGVRLTISGIEFFHKAGFCPSRNLFFGIQSGTQKLRVWNTTNWSELSTYRELAIDASEIEFSADGRRMATVESNAVVVRNPEDGEPIQRIPTSDFFTDAVFFAREGALLIFAAMEGNIRVWSVKSGELISESRPFGAFGSFDIDKTGTRIIAGGLDPLGIWLIGCNDGRDKTPEGSGYVLNGTHLERISFHDERAIDLTQPIRQNDPALVKYWAALQRVRREKRIGDKSKKEIVEPIRKWLREHEDHPRVEHTASDLVEALR